MELKKIESKKAQEFSITTLVVLVLAVIVLVIVVLGFWKGWDYIFGKIGLLPGNLEAVAQACSVSGNAGLTTSYCYEFKSVTVNGKKQYMNCEEIAKITDVKTPLTGGCTSAAIVVKVTAAAKSLCAGKDGDTLVNKVVCSTWTSTEEQATVPIPTN